jgi:hypothetical protein
MSLVVAPVSAGVCSSLVQTAGRNRLVHANAPLDVAVYYDYTDYTTISRRWQWFLQGALPFRRFYMQNYERIAPNDD